MPVKINLPPEVFGVWDRVRVGYPHTRFGMAGLGLVQALPHARLHDLMTRVAAVDEGRADWQIVEEWAENLRAQLEKLESDRGGERTRSKQRGKR